MLANPKISRALARILPFLTFGLSSNMELLVTHFAPFLDFDALDKGEIEACRIHVHNLSSAPAMHGSFVSHFHDVCRRVRDCGLQDSLQLECFCEMTQSIKGSPTGAKLKDVILESEYPQKALAYINAHMPQQGLIVHENDEMKAFLVRPALPYVLRMLQGVCASSKTARAPPASGQVIPMSGWHCFTCLPLLVNMS